MPDGQANPQIAIQFIVLPDREGRIDDAWTNGLPRHEDDPPVKTLQQHLNRSDFSSLLEVGQSLNKAHGLFFIRSGLKLPRYWRRRLCGITDSSDSLPRLPAGNYADTVNPLAGLKDLDGFEHVDGWLWLCAEHQATAVEEFPLDCLFLPPGSATALPSDSPALLLDSIFVEDAHRPLNAGHMNQASSSAALGLVRLRLQSLVDEEALPAPAPIGLDGQSITLHISHDWGGGVARWIKDVVENDTQGNHLVLSASGNPGGKTHGQFLRLFAAGPGHGEIRELPLTPAVADTQITDNAYQSLLQKLIKRFSIGRVLISSLIGHSLDALRTGLPTAQVLHDFYPAWPLLDRDPLNWLDGDGNIDLTRALAESAERLHFIHRDAAHWLALRSNWLDTVNEAQVTLIAPTREVVRRWQALCGNKLPETHVIGHGFAGWPQAIDPIQAKPAPDGKLNLVVVGRLSPGKGLNLLDQSLAQLQQHAQITLLGCGRHGMAFFGRKGVDVLLDYRLDDLPAMLARIRPQAALFLSTVPETWNYTLSELRALSIPPVATRLGSFVERIHHEKDGWLFDPQPQALIDQVAELHDNQKMLAAASANQPQDQSIAEVLKSYWKLVNIENAPSLPLRRALSDHAEIGYLGHQIATTRAKLAENEESKSQLQAQLAERTTWAQRYERLSEERTRWARSLESEIQAERVQVTERLDSLEAERQQLEQRLIDLNSAFEVSQDHLAQTRAHLQTTQDELEQTSVDLAHTRQNLHRSDFELAQSQEELRLIFASRSWRWTRPLRFFNRVVDHAKHRQAFNPLRWPRLARRLIHSLRFHGIRGTLHLAQGTTPPAETQSDLQVVETPEENAPLRPIRVPSSDSPRASIIVPVFNKVAYTAACLESITEHAGSVEFEVIVVDDCSSDHTAEFLANCEGVHVVKNAKNTGFIASCNAGAARAKGEFLVFLNNDTTVTESWLERLLDTFADFPDAGVVGARLAYPNGRLQEAGGIIFSDASGWNYGRNEDPTQPQYNFTSEADYVSGACLAISRDLFEDLNGFDNYYAPAYYEDTDLCFRVRQHGRKVYCQPACTIIHHEGVSSGTDESSGTKRYQAINRDKFRERWAEALQRQPQHSIDTDRPDPVRRARFHRAAGRALVIDATTPMPDHDSGSVRMTAALELMVEQNWGVTFCPQNLQWEGRYSSSLQRAGVEVLTAPAVTSLEAWLKSYGSDLDVVMVSRHYILDPIIKMLRRTCPQVRIIFDTVDLHYLREERQAELDGSNSMRAAAERTRKAELGLIRASDTTLVVSPVEQRLLGEIVPEADIRVLSNIHSVYGSQTPWSARQDLMFVGGFQHPPNVDAAEWLIDEIFPLIGIELPEVKLHLIGSRMPDRLRERAGPGVVVHGFVEDLSPYLNGCRLSLAPLRYGAGVKGKVNQAMAWGLPVVATACAAEGMYLVDGADVLLAEDSASFAAQVVKAYKDQDLWNQLSEGGLANVEQFFSRQAAGRVIQALLEEDSESVSKQAS
ncbi:MAG: glycosyltransferase [Wenzhouxiangella sp.]|nr:glycosyltransferase [Wenzhouxiangella sp.]